MLQDGKSASGKGGKPSFGNRPRRAFVLQIDEQGAPSYRDATASDPYENLHFFMLTAIEAYDPRRFIGIAVRPGEIIVDTAAEGGVMGA